MKAKLVKESLNEGFLRSKLQKYVNDRSRFFEDQLEGIESGELKYTNENREKLEGKYEELIKLADFFRLN